MSNSAYSVLAYMLYLPVNFFVSVYVVHRIGWAQFGVWASLTTILGYGGFLELGISTPLIKYVAEYMALGRRREINVLVSTAMVFYLAVGSAFFVSMVLASGWILHHVFHASSHDFASLRLFYIAVIGGFVLALSFSVLSSLVVGLQRADLIARRGLIVNLSSSVFNVTAVSLGYGVGGLACGWLFTAALGFVLNWQIAKRLFPPLRLNPFLFRLARLKMILHFSAKVQVTTLTLTLNDQVDQTLILYALGQRQAGYFAFAARIAFGVRSFSLCLMSGIMAAASDLAAAKETARLRELYIRTTRYLMIIDLGLCAAVAGMAHPITKLLLSHELAGGSARVALSLMIMLAGYAIWLPSQATSDILNGLGRPEIRMRADVSFLLIHIPISAFLIWRFGFYGTIIGTSATLVMTRMYVYTAGARALGVAVPDLARSSFLQPAVAALIALATVVAMQLLLAEPAIMTVVVDGALFVCIYAVYVYFRGFDTYDRAVVHSLTRPFFHALVARARL
ncbi:MAG: oligosaccharide flippase family protein [Chloroflexota bacterium]